MKTLEELRPDSPQAFLELWELAHGPSRITFTDARKLLSEAETEVGFAATEDMLKTCLKQHRIVRHIVSRRCDFRTCLFERVSETCSVGCVPGPRRGARPKRKRRNVKKV